MITTEQRLKNLQSPCKKADMVLDTDAFNEIDDQFAISYALHARDRLNVRALYAAPFFNARSSSPADGMERSYQEILKLLRLAGIPGREQGGEGEGCPVFRGSDRYLPDENTPVESDAARHLASLAMSYTPEEPLYVAAIGAITNIASALLLNPEIADRIVVVFLGGHALHWPDSMEFNMRQDVAAARVVFASGAPLVMLPCMGVVSACTTTGPELNYWLKGKNALCDYLVEHTEETANAYARGRVWSRVIWDITAIGWLLNRDQRFMRDQLIPTPIPQYDHHLSQDPRRPLCCYVYHINRDALLGDLFDTLTKAD